jgi:hypothetical protein
VITLHRVAVFCFTHARRFPADCQDCNYSTRTHMSSQGTFDANQQPDAVKLIVVTLIVLSVKIASGDLRPARQSSLAGASRRAVASREGWLREGGSLETR